MSRKLKVTLAAAFLSLFSLTSAFACPDKDKQQAGADQPKPTAPVPANVATASFKVDAMHCAGCADEIKAALAKTSGVVNVDVKVADHRVTVKFDKDKITAEKIAKLISEAGFPANAEV